MCPLRVSRKSQMQMLLFFFRSRSSRRAIKPTRECILWVVFRLRSGAHPDAQAQSLCHSRALMCSSDYWHCLNSQLGQHLIQLFSCHSHNETKPTSGVRLVHRSFGSCATCPIFAGLCVGFCAVVNNQTGWLARARHLSLALLSHAHFLTQPPLASLFGSPAPGGWSPRCHVAQHQITPLSMMRCQPGWRMARLSSSPLRGARTCADDARKGFGETWACGRCEQHDGATGS